MQTAKLKKLTQLEPVLGLLLELWRPKSYWLWSRDWGDSVGHLTTEWMQEVPSILPSQKKSYSRCCRRTWQKERWNALSCPNSAFSSLHTIGLQCRGKGLMVWECKSFLISRFINRMKVKYVLCLSLLWRFQNFASEGGRFFFFFLPLALLGKLLKLLDLLKNHSPTNSQVC